MTSQSIADDATIETVSAFRPASNPGRSNENPIWWWWHGNTKSLSDLQWCDVKCMLTSQLGFSVWFNSGYWRENTSMNIVWYMIMAFVRWSKQQRMVTQMPMFKLAACLQHQRKLVQCHKMCLLDLQSLTSGAITWKMISNSLDIDFIHGDIHGWSYQNA